MADADEPQFNSLAERIAALNKQKNFDTASPSRKKPSLPTPTSPVGSPSTHGLAAATAKAKAAPTPTPTLPPRPIRNNAPPPLPRRESQPSIASPVESSRQTKSDGRRLPPPPPPVLPSRTPSSQSSPPPRQHLAAQAGLLASLARRPSSASSERSQLSTVSSVSIGHPASSISSQASNGGRMLPPTYDPSSLPPLAPTRRELEAKAKETEAAAKEAAEKQSGAAKGSKFGSKETRPSPRPTPTVPSRPSLPPRLPSRPARSPIPPPEAAEPKPAARKLPPMPVRGSESARSTPPIPTPRQDDEAPPAIPHASRPSVTQIHSFSGRVAEPERQAQPFPDCWVCRDWSGPDAVAAQYPTASLPRNDPVGHLARGLCGPFPSSADKARAIFSWCHHNISYDTQAFFSNNVKHMEVEDTIFSGRAVCQGYAETYQAIANRAGLDCVVVCGHGKGYGHTPLKRGERPPPPKPDGHAWNAIRLDGGAWKLIDACWGAGHVCGANQLFKKEFSPGQFTMSNDKFGLRHFPRDGRHQHRSDGRTVSWQEYFRGPIDGEPPTFYSDGHQEGVAEDSVEPREKEISVSDAQAVVRFQFSKICEHWTSEANGLGKPPLLLLTIHGVDGRKDDMIPMETNGFWHWADVHARDLGAPGQTVQVVALSTMGDQDGRGVTAAEFLSKRGKVGMSWKGVIAWQLI
ncbi:hypothetical protein RJ55_08053 [Drechmeria coniospora]|nr:hypothetical protein RJ55_08053 [Drechmeria coniospora]